MKSFLETFKNFQKTSAWLSRNLFIFSFLLFFLGFGSIIKLVLDNIKSELNKSNISSAYIENKFKLNIKVIGGHLNDTQICADPNNSNCPIKPRVGALWVSNVNRNFSEEYFNYLERFKAEGLWFGLTIPAESLEILKKEAANLAVIQSDGKSNRVWVNGEERKLESTKTLPGLKRFYFIRLRDSDFSRHSSIEVALFVEKPYIIGPKVYRNDVPIGLSDGLTILTLESEYLLQESQKIINQVGIPFYFSFLLFLIGALLALISGGVPERAKPCSTLVRCNSGSILRISSNHDEEKFNLAVSFFKSYFRLFSNLCIDIVHNEKTLILNIKEIYDFQSQRRNTLLVDEHAFCTSVNKTLGVEKITFTYNRSFVGSNSFWTRNRFWINFIGLFIGIPLLIFVICCAYVIL